MIQGSSTRSRRATFGSRPRRWSFGTSRSNGSSRRCRCSYRASALGGTSGVATTTATSAENEVWGAFTGHAFAHGGAYAECRLLSSGPRTNPWFQEATDRRIEPGDLVSFDTDLNGPAGYPADLSRAYLAGDVAPTA